MLPVPVRHLNVRMGEDVLDALQQPIVNQIKNVILSQIPV